MLGDGLQLAVADLEPVEFLVPETNDRVSLSGSPMPTWPSHLWQRAVLVPQTARCIQRWQ